MLKFVVAAGIGLSAITVAAPAAAKQYTVVTPLPADVVANLNVAAVEVTLGADAAATMAKHDAKADAKRVAANRPLHDVAAPLARNDYATVPFTQMFPLVMRDVTRNWGLTGGRPVKLVVLIEEFKTANAAMAMLIGSSDVLTGSVEVQDAAAGGSLGRFKVRVVNGHGGIEGMLIRGGGIREKLSEEFALESSRVLTGRKSIKVKAKTKSASN